jgi:UDP-N-acetylglucosamine diphosphorylase / glucose-1-phosphate thymidylyltransferase / UDP-N-acetylgalactosamine diphosphorylase / glucosamine-1-phosphate N-acetyltransferase / galactosamine-1-phosphate N-acetyltransferase
MEGYPGGGTVVNAGHAEGPQGDEPVRSRPVALVLAAGRGKRVGEPGSIRNKCMLEVGGRPLLDYTLDRVIQAELDEIVLVVGYRAEDVINHYGTTYRGRRLKYVIQREQNGLVGAIDAAQFVLDGRDFLLCLGDVYLVAPRYRLMLREFHDTEAFILCGVLVVDDLSRIGRTYTLATNQGAVTRLVEKPRHAFNNLMGTGECMCSNRVLEYVAAVPVNPVRGERELVDLIQLAVDDGKVVRPFLVCDDYVNVNTEEDLGTLRSMVGVD